MKQNTQTKNAEPVKGFTGGDWISLLNERLGFVDIFADKDRGKRVARVYFSPSVDMTKEEAEANAALIADSPAMKKYIDYVREKISNGSFPYNYEDWKEVGKPDYE